MLKLPLQSSVSESATLKTVCLCYVLNFFTCFCCFADLSGVILFGASVSEMFIRDKFGQSAMSRLVIAELAVPVPTVILVSQ